MPYARTFTRHGVHCQWHDTHATSLMAARATTTARTISLDWEQCVYCAGEVPRPQERERASHYWHPLKQRLSPAAGAAARAGGT